MLALGTCSWTWEDLATQNDFFFLMTSNLRKRKETKESCSVCLFDAWRQVWKWTGDRDSISVWWAGCNFGREIISMISYIQPQTCKLAFACTIKIGADKASRWTSVASTWRCGFDCRCSNLQTSYDWNQSKTFHISSFWFGFFTFGAFCVSGGGTSDDRSTEALVECCFKPWTCEIRRENRERKFMTDANVTKMFAV